MAQMSQRYKPRPRPLSDEEIVTLLYESDAENDPEVEDLVEDSTDEDYQPVANVESDSSETEDEGNLHSLILLLLLLLLYE